MQDVFNEGLGSLADLAGLMVQHKSVGWGEDAEGVGEREIYLK